MVSIPDSPHPSSEKSDVASRGLTVAKNLIILESPYAYLILKNVSHYHEMTLLVAFISNIRVDRFLFILKYITTLTFTVN